MEMEEINFEHFDDPWTDPLTEPDLPVDVPLETDIDPCAGDRDLWVLAIPSTIDCSTGEDFTLIISPDFKCISIEQLNPFGGREIEEDAGGGLSLPAGCNKDDSGFITVAVTDCLCGGGTSVNIWTENCATDCSIWEISGVSFMTSND